MMENDFHAAITGTDLSGLSATALSRVRSTGWTQDSQIIHLCRFLEFCRREVTIPTPGLFLEYLERAAKEEHELSP